MSVTIKSKSDLLKLREAGRIAARALEHAGKVMHPGMTTKPVSYTHLTLPTILRV